VKAAARTSRDEPRWPVASTILFVLALLALLPERVTSFPAWVPYTAAIVVLVPMLGVGLVADKTRWLRIERVVTLSFAIVSAVASVATLGSLVRAMVDGSAELSGLELLASSIGVWITNMLAFSLIYWQIDLGGPAAREAGATRKPDWLFPQSGAGEAVPPDWRPVFVDYLFLGYSTATAFSTTEVAPLTSRAKLLMMAESTISLVTIVVVASRAINILGS
jgi:hypothetical protein